MSENSEQQPSFREWAVVELMGHQKAVGLVTEASIAGAKLLRVDALNEQGKVATRFYGASAIYCITPCSEGIAREMARQYGSDPINRFALSNLLEEQSYVEDDGEDDQDDPKKTEGP